MTARQQRLRLQLARRGSLLHSEINIGPVAVPVLDLLASVVLLVLAVLLGVVQPTTPVQHVALVIAVLSVLVRRDSPLLAAAILCVRVTGMALGGPGEVDCSEMLPALALLGFAAGAERGRSRAIAVGQRS